MHNLKINQKVFFVGEKLPMKVTAVSKRYVIVTRPFDKKEEKDYIKERVMLGAYCTKEEAYNDLKDDVVYSILDFEENIKGADNMSIGIHDYKTKKDCKEAIKELISGELEISYRNRCELNIDWNKTNCK